MATQKASGLLIPDPGILLSEGFQYSEDPLGKEKRPWGPPDASLRLKTTVRSSTEEPLPLAAHTVDSDHSFPTS